MAILDSSCSIALARDPDDLQVLRKALGNRFNDVRIYTLFAHRFLELAQRGFQPHILSEHITAEEAYAIYRRAFEDSACIADTFPLTECPVKINLARFYKVFLWEYLSEVYALDLALGRILDQLDGATFVHVQQRYPLPTSHAALTDADSISEQMLRVISRQRPQAVRPVFGAVARPVPLIQDRARPFLRSLKRTVFALVERAKALKAAGKPSVAPEARAIALGSGYDALIVIPDVLRLAAESGRVPLLMTEGVDKDTTRTGLVWKEEYDRIERFSITEYLSAHPVPPLSSAEQQQADRAFNELMNRLRQIDEVRRYGLTATMGQLRYEFHGALWRAKALDRVLVRFSGSAIVVTHFNGLDGRIIEQLAKCHDIELHARPHGWMNSFEAFEFIADHYYCDGLLRAKLLDEVYHYGDRIGLSPDPSLINVSHGWLDKEPTEQQAIIMQWREALSIQANYVVLFVTTAARFRRVLNEFDYPKLLDCWDTVLGYLKIHLDIHVIVKSHKYNFDKWVAELAAERGVRNLTILSGRLEDALIRADLVVDLGKPGTATLSALLFERPLLLYRGLYKYVREFGDMVHTAGASFCINSPEALIEEWDSMRQDYAAYKKELRTRNRVLRDLLAQTTTPHSF